MTSIDKYDLQTQFLSDTMLSQSTSLLQQTTKKLEILPNEQTETGKTILSSKVKIFFIISCYGSHMNVLRRTIHGIVGRDI